jgi:aquaporin Z
MEHLVRLAAELVATLCVCLAAILAAAGTGAGDSGRLVAALGYGLAVTAAMHAFGGQGPVHANPAVTLAVFSTGRGTIVRAIACIVGQLVGAVLAGLTAMWLLAGLGTGLGMPAGSFTRIDPVRTTVVEGLLSFLWAAAFLGSVYGSRLTANAGVPVGLTVAAGTLAGAAFTGGAMNPARAIASAVAADDFSTLWMYAAGALAGGAVAGLVGRLFLPPERPDPPSLR